MSGVSKKFPSQNYEISPPIPTIKSALSIQTSFIIPTNNNSSLTIKMATANHVACTTAIEGRLSNVSDSTSTSSFSDQEDCTQINSSSRHRSRKWRKLMKKVVEGSKKTIYGSSKPLIFRYDAVSYSLNFDEGTHGDEYYSYGSRCSQVFG
ncbi:hypothetical protein L2E82_18668 [Cichorium intybus]|uniref:Uncharacterized protein n=1 Tax=Cichorium intybus TaxID=13427 RepID=A0ACB9FBB5_CICIN|nr:hypothetical protein L2E82_18668 [Cichorium intybus]